MQIIVTQDDSHECAISAEIITFVHRAAENKLLTYVVTGVPGPKGPMAFLVKESPIEVARRINNALKSEVHPALLGFPEAN